MTGEIVEPTEENQYYITDLKIHTSWLDGDFCINFKTTEVTASLYLLFPSKPKQFFEQRLGREIKKGQKIAVKVEETSDTLNLVFVFVKNGIDPEKVLNFKPNYATMGL